MASNTPINEEFNWGESVQVKKNACNTFKPLEIGSICGMRSIESEDLAKQFNSSVGNILYLVEFSSGASLEIPGEFLSRFTSSHLDKDGN